MKRLLTLTAATIFCTLVSANAGDTPAPEGAMQYIVNLKDGDTVTSPVTVIFGIKGMGVAPAGVEKEHTGHHHIFLNRPLFGEGEEGKDEYDANIPADENHIHFGGGQTEKKLELTPGKHTIQLVFADKDHIPHNPPIFTEQITINVK